VPLTASAPPSAGGSNTVSVKTYNHLFHHIISFDNLLLAARKAQKSKRFKPATALFNLNLEKELLRLQRQLIEKRYNHGTYCDFIIYDPKMRLISAAPYRDRVVHHALCNVIEPLFDRSFIHDTYACRKGKGTHVAVDRYTVFARKNRYVLKCDIKKYFPSIDQDILLQIIRRKIKCADTLWLIEQIIRSRNDSGAIQYFPEDDLFTPFQRVRGLAIGNLTSQFFANVYLDGFDHFVKETLRCRYYIRYVDDFVLFNDSKSRLNELKAQMIGYLNTLRLRLHPRKCRVYRVDEGVSFLGYRMYPNHRLLKKQNVLHFRRKLKKMQYGYRQGHISGDAVKQSIQSWIAHAGHADTYALRCRILAGMVFQRG
jgi:retron-type reverse transcriptase